MIDEIQRAPQLLLAIKKSVDEDRRPGRFLLTGLANRMLLPTVVDSLAGRMKTLSLLPLSQSELHGSDANWIDAAFAGNLLKVTTPIVADALVEAVLQGGYRTALYLGYQSLTARQLCTATVVEVCRTIKATDLDVRLTPGTQLMNDRTGEVIYTPPEGEACLRELLANWERFLHNQTELDPLVRMAVGHYQFEAIHPFADGNGRSGRVLNILYLIQPTPRPTYSAYGLPARAG